MAIPRCRRRLQIADPNPLQGTNNQYRLDGRYSDCANLVAPGVFPIVRYLESLRFSVAINCAAGHYYMLNNGSASAAAEKQNGVGHPKYRP